MSLSRRCPCGFAGASLHRRFACAQLQDSPRASGTLRAGGPVCRPSKEPEEVCKLRLRPRSAFSGGLFLPPSPAVSLPLASSSSVRACSSPNSSGSVPPEPPPTGPPCPLVHTRLRLFATPATAPVTSAASSSVANPPKSWADFLGVSFPAHAPRGHPRAQAGLLRRSRRRRPSRRRQVSELPSSSVRGWSGERVFAGRRPL